MKFVSYESCWRELLPVFKDLSYEIGDTYCIVDP